MFSPASLLLYLDMNNCQQESQLVSVRICLLQYHHYLPSSAEAASERHIRSPCSDHNRHLLRPSLSTLMVLPQPPSVICHRYRPIPIFRSHNLRFRTTIPMKDNTNNQSGWLSIRRRQQVQYATIKMSSPSISMLRQYQLGICQTQSVPWLRK